MKTKLALIAFAFSILTGCSSAKTASPVPADPAAEARALHRDFVEAFNAGDANTLTSLYSKDSQTVLFPPDELAARGGDSIYNCFASIATEMPGAQLSLTEENFRPEGDGFASWGLWEMWVPTPHGGTTMRGRYTETMIRENGKLVLLVDHASVPVQKAAPPKHAAATHKPKAAVKHTGHTAKKTKHRK